MAGTPRTFSAEVILKQKLEKILGKVNHARTYRKG